MDVGTEAAPGHPLERGAFADLVARHHALVCAVAFGATGDRALSEDVAQDTFVVAWRGRHTLRDPSRARQWLCAIARHLALNTRRRRAHDPIDDDAAIAGDVDLHAHLEHAQRDAMVWQAIAAIPETYRLALVLYYREDKSVAEVASALGISESNALQRLSRGRRHLEKGIEELVARSLASSKPDRAHQHAVLAAIGADLTPLSADAALEAARVSVESASWKVTIMKVAIATGALVGAVALVQWGCAGEGDKASVAEAPPEAEVAGAAAPGGPDGAREQAQRAALERAMKNDAVGDAAAHGDDEVASRIATDRLPDYRVSIVDEDGVAVNLAGGPSGLMGAGEALGIDMPAKPRKPQRTVKGRVVDAAGAPVQGAVVIAGRHLAMMLDTSVSARAGDETDARGRFEVSVDADERCGVLALHREGWSALEVVEAATKDASLDLEIAAPVHVHGVARRGETPQDGIIIATDAVGTFTWTYPTDDDGGYSMLLPRGAFTLGFRPGERFAAGDPLVRAAIDLRAGAEHEWNPKVVVGTRLAVDVPMPPADAERVRMFWVGVLPGRVTPKGRDEVEAAAKAGAGRLLGHGGQDLEEVFEFEDLAAGTYTVCAEAAGRRDEPRIAFACNEVVVTAGDEVHEVKLAW